MTAGLAMHQSSLGSQTQRGAGAAAAAGSYGAPYGTQHRSNGVGVVDFSSLVLLDQKSLMVREAIQKIDHAISASMSDTWAGQLPRRASADYTRHVVSYTHFRPFLVS